MKKNKIKTIELANNTSTNKTEYNNLDDEDILIEGIPTENKSSTRKRVVENNEKITDIAELKKLIYSYDPPEIKDWPKRPYKTILIVFLLLLCGILFTGVGIAKYSSDHTYDVYLPFTILGILLFIPGIYYTFILANVLLGVEGYEYSDIPDLSES